MSSERVELSKQFYTKVLQEHSFLYKMRSYSTGKSLLKKKEKLSFFKMTKERNIGKAIQKCRRTSIA